MMRVYDGRGQAIWPPGEPLTLDEGAHYRCCVGVATERGDPLERIWLLEPGMLFGWVPAAEQYAARALLKSGQRILLLTNDEVTGALMRCALLDLIDLMEMPGNPVSEAGYA